MKKTYLAIAVFAALATFAFALSAGAETVEERQIKINIVTDAGETLALDLSDMEIGDTQQLFTDAGAEVAITRTEAGFSVVVEGEDEPLLINIPSHGHHGHGEMGHGGHGYNFDVDCDGDDCERHVVIHKEMTGGDDGNVEMMFIDGDGEHMILEGDEDTVWVGGDGEGADGEKVIVRRFGGDPAQRLIDSGALDGLSEEKRQEILDAVRGPHPAHGKRMIKIKKKVGGDEENE